MGLVGDPFGQKYAEVGPRRLSIGNQVTRKQRENVLTGETKRGIREKPGVGKYYPQYTLVSKRPQTQGFSQIERPMNIKSKPTETQIKVPKAFEDQLKRIRMEKIIDIHK